MESLINTYRLNQGNKEYILTIKTMGQTIKITCKNALDENINFSRDFTVGQLQKLDEIFYNIKTPNDALEYIDKALKEQKIGVTEEGETIQINFYVSNEGSSHNLKMTLGEGGSSSTNNHTEIVETTTTNTTSSFGMNQNLGVDPNSVYGTTITTKTTFDLMVDKEKVVHVVIVVVIKKHIIVVISSVSIFCLGFCSRNPSNPGTSHHSLACRPA